MKTRLGKRGNRVYDLRGDGSIVLYTRSGVRNQNYHTRIRVSGLRGYRRLSTRSNDFREAEAIAREYHARLLEGSAVGTDLYPKKFCDILNEFVLHNDSHYRNIDARGMHVFKKYVLVFFGDHNISKITAREIKDFANWRRENYVRKPPCDATIRREVSYLKGVFSFALKKGVINTLPDLSFSIRKRDFPILPFFSTEEHNRIQDVILSWIRDGKYGWRDRFIFSNLIGISVFSGLKAIELSRLKYNDFFLKKNTLCCSIESSSVSRVVELEGEAKDYIRNLRNLRTEELGHEPLNNEQILYNPRITRAPINTRKCFISLLDFANIDILKNGVRRQVSSFRNLYIYKAIKRNLPDYFIANQLNVSPRTISRYKASFAEFKQADLAAEDQKTNLVYSPISWKEFLS